MVESEVDMDMSITQTENCQFFCVEEEEEDEKNNEIAYLGRGEEMKPRKERVIKFVLRTCKYIRGKVAGAEWYGVMKLG